MRGLVSRKILLISAFFLTIILVILFNWYRQGLIIANSEEGLNIYNIKKTSQIYSSVWYENDLGYKNPFNLVRFPVFFVLSYFEGILPNYLLQASLIGVLMFGGLFAAYLFARKVVEVPEIISIIAATFYLLNLFTLSQVWRRFLYNGMFAWTYYPLFLFFLVRFVTLRKFRWLALFLLTSVVFSYSFGHPAFIIVYWSTAGIFATYFLWINRLDRKKQLKIILQFGLALITWVIANFWWLNPLIRSTHSYIEETVQSASNLELLKGVSPSFPVSDIVVLSQSWWYGKDNHWYQFYSNPSVVFIKLAVLFFIVYGILKHRKVKFYGFLLAAVIIGIFVSKGTNPPLGETFFKFLFDNFSFTGSLRNSYEKFGLVLLLPYSIFFALGVVRFSQYFRQWSFIALTFIIFLVEIVLVIPMWNGSVFLAREKVQVPRYYQDANGYLNNIGSQRILVLPVTESGNVGYSWGFYGQNSNEFLFDRETISNSSVNPLKSLISKNAMDNPDFPSQLGALGIKEIVVNNDFSYPEKIVIDKNSLNKWQGISKTKSIGALDIYTISENLVKSIVYVKNQNSGSVEGLPQIAFKKNSAQSFSVKVENVNVPIILVLNSNFDTSWRARINHSLISEHILVNDLVNGWIIKDKGNLSVEINLEL